MRNTSYRFHVLAAMAASALLSHVVHAGDVPAFTDFIDGTAAKAADVNDKFNALRKEVNDNNARINALNAAAKPVDTGFRASFDFEEGAGNKTADGSGYGTTLTFSTSGVSWTTSGHSGNALNFDGSSGYVTAPDIPALNPTLGLTISAWVYQTGNGTTLNCVVCKEGQYVFGVNKGQVQLAVQTQKGPPLGWFGSGSVPLNVWTQIAASYDGVAIRTFVNGALTSYTTYSNGPLAASANPLQIGARSTSTEYFAGRVDEVRILGQATDTQAGMSTLVKWVGPLSDQRNSSTKSAASVWWDIPERTLSFTKRYDHSPLKITYQDTLGTYGTDYAGCEWQILLDAKPVASFSDADLTGALGWRMSNAAHMAWVASAPTGPHIIKVQNRGRIGAWTTTTECLQGWNTTGNFLSVEELP